MVIRIADGFHDFAPIPSNSFSNDSGEPMLDRAAISLIVQET